MSYENEGYVNIWWTDAIQDIEWWGWRVYRRKTGSGDPWTMLAETQVDSPLYEYHDWLAESGVQYDYVVAQVALRFGSLVESEYEAQTVTPTSSHYWLIDEYDENNNIKLLHVTADSYQDEYETEEIPLVDHGRHIDVGEHWGVKGSLTVSIRDDELTGLTAREQRQQIERFRERRDEAWLRTPFGDIWRVGIHNIDFGRDPGVGLREYGSLTIPYSEVSANV